MPLSGPSEDPAEDKERPDEYDPEVYVINVELHHMIVEADQAAGIIMEAADEEEEEEEKSPSTPVTCGHETKKQHTARRRRIATEEHTKFGKEKGAVARRDLASKNTQKNDKRGRFHWLTQKARSPKAHMAVLYQISHVIC